MKKLRYCLAATAVFAYGAAAACTNFIVTKGASTDGSAMVSYAADSHALYGALYHTPGGSHKAGTMMPVYEWDTGRYLTDIPQLRETYSTVGNMNEHSLIIGETTYGGRPELADSTGLIDYGSLIYITLQRAKTAREAIATIAELANTYGYASSGESFSIVDRDEAWIMELIGKGYKADGKGGNANKGIVWVARRIPDGYVSAHANQARITTFPKNDPENCLYAPDVVSFAREMGYYDGPDADFSFCDAYAPLDFGALRACEARVWAFFRTVADDMDRYADYAMGHNAANRMPLWVMPREKVSPKTVFDCMRDHYEGTPMDMTADIGAGGSACPYRWRPMEFEVDGVSYVNERATATQQTGFWFVAQARPWNPDGYVSAHANQARITTFPKNDPENCLYAPDVVSFAREMGYYDGPDADFSFCDAYAPLDFGALRACEARVWAFFRTVADDMDRYADYAMGHNAANRMPLWVMPREKVSPKTVFDCMRDHYEGTPMDMTADIGAGGSACPYRWRPMEFEVDGVSYVNERATATQQTGFWFVAQARPWNPADMGILWFGVDDAATSCLTPIYCSAQEVPACLSEQNGSMLEYSPTAAFWLFNRVTNFAYMRYDMISADIRKVADKWENGMLKTVREVDAEALSLSPKARGKFLTAFSTATAQQLFDRWSKLDKYLLVKYMDGNVKSEKADVLTFLDGDGGPAHFVDNGNGRNIPDKIQFPGYNEKWKRAVAKDNGEILRVVK